jgi:thiol-disulfide isomerase/thioredoxin
MKKLLLMIAVAISMVSCGKGDFSVTATFDNSDANGKKAYLVNYDTGDTIDSVTIANKCLHFEGKVDHPYMARLLLEQGRIMFVVEKGDISIDVKKHSAAGTDLNDALAKISTQEDAFDQEGMKIESDLQSGKISPDGAKKLSQAVEAKVKDFFKATYLDNKKNPVGIWAFLNYVFYADLNSAQLEKELADAPKSYMEMTRVKKAVAGAKQKEKTAVGKHFTDFTVKMEDGAAQKFSQFVGHGSYVLADFWASWCGPCRKEIENIKQIYQQYGDKGLTVVGVAVWDKPQDTMGAIQSLQIPWPIIINGQNIPTDAYGITAIPHIIIFAPDGTILSRGLQGAELKAKVAELMAGK